ncbi:T9SS type A sorting domain-containing protein [bacterium]|nr:T9SS type A sorting domain-containing protein [bacterium]
MTCLTGLVFLALFLGGTTVTQAQDATYSCNIELQNVRFDPTTGPYASDPFLVTATVTNTGSVTGIGLTASLNLESWLTLMSGQNGVVLIADTLQPGETSQPVTWNVKPIVRNDSARVDISVTFSDDNGNSIACVTDVLIPSAQVSALSVTCESDPTELIPDTVHGGYVQDTITIRAVIHNIGGVSVKDIQASATPMNPTVSVRTPSAVRHISQLDPGDPGVEVSWVVQVGSWEQGDSACVLILVHGDEPSGNSTLTYECTTCFQVPEPGQVTSVRSSPLPSALVLRQNYPNPFSPSTTISYAVPTTGHVRITVSDLLGRHIATLVEGNRSAGWHSVNFNSAGVPAGMYFYRMETGGTSRVRRMIISR